MPTKESLAKNFIFQMLYQIIVLVIPMVLSPYLTRTLQETSLGIYSYVHSISYYFVIVANLGISKYGQRLIAQNREDMKDLRKAFWSLFSFHALFSLIITMLYFVMVSLFVKSDLIVFYIDGFFVVSALFDITWLFYGIENFKSVIIKNFVIKIIQCICIFSLYIHQMTFINMH